MPHSAMKVRAPASRGPSIATRAKCRVHHKVLPVNPPGRGYDRKDFMVEIPYRRATLGGCLGRYCPWSCPLVAGAARPTPIPNSSGPCCWAIRLAVGSRWSAARRLLRSVLELSRPRSLAGSSHTSRPARGNQSLVQAPARPPKPPLRTPTPTEAARTSSTSGNALPIAGMPLHPHCTTDVKGHYLPRRGIRRLLVHRKIMSSCAGVLLASLLSLVVAVEADIDIVVPLRLVPCDGEIHADDGDLHHVQEVVIERTLTTLPSVIRWYAIGDTIERQAVLATTQHVPALHRVEEWTLIGTESAASRRNRARSRRRQGNVAAGRGDAGTRDRPVSAQDRLKNGQKHL